jgi:extradiol dioxygenase family protein
LGTPHRERKRYAPPRLNRPFHHAFAVKDLPSTRSFYGQLLGCVEGRSTETWVDFDFFGNQISAHLGSPAAPAAVGEVDGVAVPIPHTGALLGWDEFHGLAARLEAAALVFVIRPSVRYPGLAAEQATMFFLDPSGNAIELKAFRHPAAVFAR